MRIEILNEALYFKYEEFIKSFEYGLFYYSIKYKDFLEELLQCKSNYLLVIDKDENIQAILPLMIKEGKFGKIVNSLPYYGSNGGILSRNNQAFEFLLNEYNKISNEVAGSTYITNPLQENIQELDYDILDSELDSGHYWIIVKI